MKVMVFAAHADDEVLGVGGTIARHDAARDEVVVVITGDCRSARVDLVPSLPIEAQHAAAILGHGVRFLGFRAMTLADGPELLLTQRIEALLREARPDVVYTHHPADPNTDHRAVARSVMVATRPIGPDAPNRILCFETPSSTDWYWGGGFVPNVFVDITNTLDRKLAAMACYETELRPPPHPRGIEALRTRAAYWGQVAGCMYAEPFVLAREVV